MNEQEFEFLAKKRNLTQKQRLVFIGRKYKKLKYSEMAYFLGISPSRTRQIFLKVEEKLNHPETKYWQKIYREF